MKEMSAKEGNMSLGLGVMINMLGGNEESVEAYKSVLGKKISSIKLVDNAINFKFTDNTKLTLWDDGQSCCESRYMSTDDNLEDFTGAKLIGIGTRDVEAPRSDEDYDVHDIEFLVVETDKGSFTCETHNVHNGYYGGFFIKAKTE